MLGEGIDQVGIVDVEGVTSCRLSLGLPVLGYRAPPMTRRLQVGGAALSANDPQLGRPGGCARAPDRPLCLCRQPAAPMYVARVAGQFIPKRMPGTGVQHDPRCESYEAPPELSGFGDVVGRAIQEDADSGVTVLRLGLVSAHRPETCACGGSS